MEQTYLETLIMVRGYLVWDKDILLEDYVKQKLRVGFNFQRNVRQKRFERYKNNSKTLNH